MPSTRPTVDPVLDILEEMGYDFDELDGDGYKRSLKEAIIRLTNKDAGDPRIEPLTIELQKVKGSRKVQAKEKKTTIKAAKLLPGTTFSPQDIKPDSEADIEEDGNKKNDVIAFLNGDVKDKLDEINQSVIEIKDVIITQGDLADDRDEEMRQAILADRKSKREKNLEKKKGLKDKLLEPVTKPVGNFLNKLIRFVMMTFVGSVVNRLLTLLKDPAQFLDPIKRFFNFIIGMVNAVMKGLWNITGAPINFIINGINKGVSSLLDSINKATGLLKIPPIEAPEIPLIPGPPQFEFIPLSKTAQEKNEAVQGASEGGIVADAKDISVVEGGEVTQDSGVTIEGMGTDTQLLAATPGEQVVTAEGVKRQQEETGTQPIDFNMGPNANQPTVNTTNNITAASTGGVIGKTVQPRTPLAPKITRMSVGGIVPSPYNASNSFGFGDTYNQNVISPAPNNIMGYNRGGDVTSNTSNKNITSNISNKNIISNNKNITSNTSSNIVGYNRGGDVTSNNKNITSNTSSNIVGYNRGGDVTSNTSNKNITSNTFNVSNKTDSVDAKLTPGEIVMNQVQQQNMIEKTGVDPASFVPAPQPGKVKFASGGVVSPDIPAPNKKGGGVVVIGGGGGSQAPRGVQSSGDSGTPTPQFSSTDPNNITIPVVKSLYNIMS